MVLDYFKIDYFLRSNSTLDHDAMTSGGGKQCKSPVTPENCSLKFVHGQLVNHCSCSANSYRVSQPGTCKKLKLLSRGKLGIIINLKCQLTRINCQLARFIAQSSVCASIIGLLSYPTFALSIQVFPKLLPSLKKQLI